MDTTDRKTYKFLSIVSRLKIKNINFYNAQQYGKFHSYLFRFEFDSVLERALCSIGFLYRPFNVSSSLLFVNHNLNQFHTYLTLNKKNRVFFLELFEKTTRYKFLLNTS